MTWGEQPDAQHTELVRNIQENADKGQGTGDKAKQRVYDDMYAKLNSTQRQIKVGETESWC